MKRLLMLLIFCASPLWAVQPDEILDDPALEARARALSQGLRCLVCRNESIDESNASLARDLRLLVRERLVAGDSDEEAVNFIVDRYGEYVLLNPRRTGSTLLLWGAGPLMLLLAGIGALLYLRKRSRGTGPEGNALTPDERARLDDILNR
ncbi:MAG: cytochrome C biogenesis protein CcdA [Rhodobacteraceae bacterium]|nr:cytochrome C biogenesis protein CcdA [Paracoccaceae bacterium]